MLLNRDRVIFSQLWIRTLCISLCNFRAFLRHLSWLLGCTKSHLSQVDLHGLTFQSSLVPCLSVVNVCPDVIELSLQAPHSTLEVLHFNVVGIARNSGVKLSTCLLGNILSLEDLLRLEVNACLDYGHMVLHPSQGIALDVKTEARVLETRLDLW